MEKYYLLYNCDEWKSFSSMRLVGLFTEQRLREVVRERVKKNSYNFDQDVDLIDAWSIRQIDNVLEYGYIQQVNANEIVG